MDKPEYDDPALTQFVTKEELQGMDSTFSELAKSGKSLVRLPRKQFDRQKVLNALEEAFELIGGVPRLAMWGHQNPTEFYKLWGKTIPAATQMQVSGQIGAYMLRPALPPSPLDGDFSEADFTEVEGPRKSDAS